MRAAVVLVEDGAVALIERVRGGRTYYLFPGGGVDLGERPEAAAAREALEELGLIVQIDRLVARARFDGHEQRYYLAHAEGGTFSTGRGEEMSGADFEGHGSYRALRLPLDALATIDVRPAELVRLLVRAEASGDWPEGVSELGD